MNLSDKVETRRETFYKLTNSEVAPEAPSIGGRNLLTGTRDWNSNIKRWATNNRDWNDEPDEYNNLKVKSTTGGWNGWHQNVFVKAGEYYTLSYYAKSDTNISVKNSLSWEHSPIFEGPVATFDGNNDIRNNITTEWKRHSRTVKITGNGSLQWRIEYDGVTLPSGKWYIAGMKLEERSSASNYNVAPEDLGWTMNILVPNQSNRYLWKFEYIYYSDGTIEVTDPINLSVAGQNGEDGKNSYIHTAYANITKMCNENGSFTLTKETIMRFGFGDKWVYKTFGPGTYTANNTTFGKDPYLGKVKQCDAVTDFSLSDSTGRSWLGAYSNNSVNAVSDPSYYTWQLTKGDRGEDGIPGKDGVGLRSTLVTYGLSRSETDKPITWYSQVPTLTKGDYLWTKTVWTYTDNTSETGYQKTYIARDGNNGNDGIPGKDGVGIKSTTITYASSTSGTTRPTSGWSSTIPNVPAGQYLWTKTVWTYTDNTSETGYSVAKMGADGVGQLTTWTFYKLTNTTSAPQVVPIGSSTNLSHLGPNNAWTPYKELRENAGWRTIDFDKIAKSDIIPDKPFTWYLEASFDGVSNYNGSTDFDIRFENWYRNSAGSSVYNPLGIKIFTANKFSATNDTAVNNYFNQSITWTVPRSVYDAIPEGGFLNLRIRIDRFTKLFYHAKNSYVTYGTVPSDPAKKGLGNYSTYGWKASPEVSTQALPYLWVYQIQFYSNGREVAIPPTLIGAQGSDGNTPYMHFAYADDNRGTNFSLTDNNQRYQGYYSDYTEADSTDYRRYKWVDRLANVQIGTVNLIKGTGSPFIMGYGITNTTWNETKKQTILDFSTPGARRDITGEILPQGNKFFDFKPIKGMTYTQSIMIDTDATFEPNGEAMCTWFTPNGHNLQKAYIKKVGDYSYQVWSTYTWNLDDVALRAFDWYNLHNILRFRTTGTYLAFYKPKMTTGNLPSDWEAAPEDVQDQINDKADQELTQEQLNALAEKNALIQAEMEAKASMDTVNQWITAYQNYVNANNADKKKSEQELQDASNRLLQVQYDVKDLKQQWNFIDTYMSVQNEGLIIGKKDGSAYAKFSNDRISLFSGNSEVMYISQGTLNIANGIFTKTIQIGRFRFETHPADVDMLVIRYLGG